MFSILSDKHKVLIKPYSTAIAKCFEDFFFLAEHYIVIGVITKENCIKIVAVYVYFSMLNSQTSFSIGVQQMDLNV